MLKDFLNWPHLQQVFKLERQFTYLKTGKVTTQISYGMTSLSADEASPHQLLHYLRDYWGIENGLLTPTLKIKRSELEKHFAQEIKEMYRGHVLVE